MTVHQNSSWVTWLLAATVSAAALRSETAAALRNLAPSLAVAPAAAAVQPGAVLTKGFSS
jgi:hypothetical protein